MRRIGVFGGTFNPVHNAHIIIAERALSELSMDFVIMMTGGNPPHKKDSLVLDAKLRHIMLKKAIKGHEKLIACDYEVKKHEYSYTVNTLRFLKRIYPDDELYFIMGGDSIDYFDDWYKPDEIASLAKLVVYSRGAKHRTDEIEKMYNIKITRLSGDNIDISSTEIRNDEKSLSSMPQSVSDFIEKFKLYKDISEKEMLERMLDENRLMHSIGVSKFAGELAERYGLNIEKAKRCGLLHDIAKCIPYSDAIIMCDELEAELDPIERHMPPLVHAKLGAELVKCFFGIREGEITSAIRSHTVGKPNMSLFDKIIFVADMCEEGRTLPDLDIIRKTSFEDIDMAVIMCIDKSISYNNKTGKTVHPMAYAVKAELSAK